MGLYGIGKIIIIMIEELANLGVGNKQLFLSNGVSDTNSNITAIAAIDAGYVPDWGAVIPTDAKWNIETDVQGQDLGKSNIVAALRNAALAGRGRERSGLEAA